MAGKFYAVRKGRAAGVYDNWEDCRRMVEGFAGAVYKSFRTRQEAESFIGEASQQAAPKQAAEESAKETEKLPETYAFVDGSYNSVTKIYGYGGFLQTGTERIELCGAGDEPEMASMRNVAGEVLGSRAAIEKAVSLGIRELTIYYDYMGIEMWATGSWKRNKKGTIAYYEYVQSVQNKIELHFVKVKGHSGVEGNEEADRLAKKKRSEL